MLGGDTRLCFGAQGCVITSHVQENMGTYEHSLTTQIGHGCLSGVMLYILRQGKCSHPAESNIRRPWGLGMGTCSSRRSYSFLSPGSPGLGPAPGGAPHSGEPQRSHPQPASHSIPRLPGRGRLRIHPQGRAPHSAAPLGESAPPALRLLKTSLGQRGAAVRRRGRRRAGNGGGRRGRGRAGCWGARAGHRSSESCIPHPQRRAAVGLRSEAVSLGRTLVEGRQLC